MPPLVRPLIAIVAALAVAAAAVLIGLHFAQPTAPTTITVPVLAPTQGKTNSAKVGSAVVTAPGSVAKGALDKGTLATIDALNHGTGLSDADAARTAAGRPAAGTLGADDPCATAGASGSCPGGLQGTIAFDTFSTPADLTLFLATPDGAGSVFDCPAGTTIEAVTTTPADVTLRYWTQDDPTDVQTYTMHSQPGDADRWAAANTARGGYTHDLETFQHCAPLPFRSIAYTVQATAIDVLLRISATKTLQFDPRGPAVEPSMLVLPVGANQLYVSVPSQPELLPDVRAWVVPTGTAPDCSSYTNSTRLLDAVPRQVLTLDAPTLLRAHFDPTYTKRVVDVFSAPEGSTIVVCARWFDHAGPTWNVTSPVKQRAVVAQSPDALTPIVFFDSYNLSSGVPEYAFDIYASTVQGVSCGTDALFPVEANQTGNRSGLGRQLCIESDRLDLGIAGDVTVTVHYHQGTTNLDTSSVLPLRSRTCLGVCALPQESHFQLPVSTDHGVVGSVHLTVRWQQGHQNGRSSWNIGGVDATAPSAAVPDNPQFDTSTVMTSTVSADGWSANAATTIRSDRHATYRATIAGDCSNADSTTVVTGETTGAGQVWSAPIAFTGLCTNTYYVTTVVLTDDNGNRTTADVNQHDIARYWNGGVFVSATRHLVITGIVTASQPGTTGGRAWEFSSVQQSIGGYPLEWVPVSSPCQPVATRTIPVTVLATVPRAHQVHVQFVTTVTEQGLYYGVSHDSDCSWPTPTVNTATFDHLFSYEDLLAGVDISIPFTYTFPSGLTNGTNYTLHVHLTTTDHS